MYAEFFGLSKDPFSIAPDPRFLFMSEKHREALAHLLYGVGGGGGFVLLTGEIGAGKTTVCRAFLEQIPRHCDVAYIFNPKLTVSELLQSVCEEFHVALAEPALAGASEAQVSAGQAAAAPTVKTYVDAINRFLLAAHAAGRSAVLIIDEAQSLAPDVLEQLRLLTNLETHERKLLQIILIGQPELRDMLASPGLEQLAQRVIARCHLGALTAGETVRYVQHRLAVAGASGGTSVPFEPEAMSRLFQLTGGVPRRINLLAGRAMLGAYAHGRNQVDRAMVEQAAREVFDVRRGGGARAAARAAGVEPGSSRSTRPAASSSGSPSRPAPLGSSAGSGRPAVEGSWRNALARPGARVAAAVVAGGAIGLALGAWAWRDGWLHGGSSGANGAMGAASSVAAAGSAAAAAAALPPPMRTAGAVTGSGSASAIAGSGGSASSAAAGPAGRLAAGAALAVPADTLSRDEDPAMVLAAAWADEASAWRALAMAWHAPLAEGDVCTKAAPAAGLACHRTRGGLAAVRQLDRPGLVFLRQRDEPPVVALLVALDERGATLQTHGRHWRLSLAALATVWRGDFATLWRTPPGWRDAAAALPPAALPASARAWVNERLVDAGVRDAGQPLRDRLWAYQVAQGLPPDGLLGPVTMMQLGRGTVGFDEPALRRPLPREAAAGSAAGAATATSAPAARGALANAAPSAAPSAPVAAAAAASAPGR
ncbi:MAG: AAA family ATPase [Rubrivivax sp.]|nr:AAA family ATPase [Rubrivivax sp.]